nr:Type VII secretion system protein eccB1 [Streptococcus thermophilus]
MSRTHEENTPKEQTAQRLLPTTRSQVSGHRFMRRRVEHGLIYGDIRMIHDPLASRRRSAIFGLIAVALIAGGCGLFAWLKPNPDPGSAAIMRAADGSLYVRVGEVVHPVTNLTSARLIAGSPDEPQRVGDERLTDYPRGVPLGLTTAPAMFAPEGSDDIAWSACSLIDVSDTPTLTIHAGPAPELLEPHEAIVVAHDGDDWLVTRAGRAKLPPAGDPAGRLIRRELGIDAATPRREMHGGVLGALRELPPIGLPRPLPRVLETQGEAWALTSHGGVQQITQLQRDVLVGAGAQPERTDASAIAAYPDADPPLALSIPEEKPQWIDHSVTSGAPDTAVCAAETGEAGTRSAGSLTRGAIELSGAGPATHFIGLSDGAVGVDTGSGYHVVSGAGQRHSVDQQDVLEMIGVAHMEKAPWAIVSLLPAGPDLTREGALTATY